MPVLLAGLASSLLGCADYVAGYGSRRSEHPGAAVSIAWLASFVGVAVSGAYLLVFPPEAGKFVAPESQDHPVPAKRG